MPSYKATIRIGQCNNMALKAFIMVLIFQLFVYINLFYIKYYLNCKKKKVLHGDI